MDSSSILRITNQQLKMDQLSMTDVVECMFINPMRHCFEFKSDENPLERASPTARINLFQTSMVEIDAASHIVDHPIFPRPKTMASFEGLSGDRM
jgi:hypothetical protein